MKESSDIFQNLTSSSGKNLSQPINKLQDKWKLIPSYLKLRGLVKQHIDSFNYFVQTELKQIIRAQSNRRVTIDQDPNFYLQYKDIRLQKPVIDEDYTKRQLYPHECRVRDLTYSATIVVDIQHVKGNQRFYQRNVPIGKMPIMLGSANCWLHQMSHEELARISECPYDPRGYFIVRGVERVILIQEQTSKNRIIIQQDSKKNLLAQVTSSTHERKSRTTISTKNGKFYLKHNSLADDIPIVVVFKAMGMFSDQEIVQLVGTQKRYMEAITLSVYECSMLGILTQEQALNFIGSKVKSIKMVGSVAITRGNRSRVDQALDVLSNLVLAHVPCSKQHSNKIQTQNSSFNSKNYNLLPKCRYMAVMLRRIIQAQNDLSKLDDKDYYGNKRLQLAGQLLSLLFEDLFKKFNFDLMKSAQNLLPKFIEKRQVFDITKYFRLDTITMGMANAISTGNWSLKRFKMERAGVTQVLSRQSYIAALGMMTRITSQFEKTRKISGPRSLQPSQWGMLCPSDTPQGQSCGLVKNFALMTHVTTDSAVQPLHRIALDLGVEDIALLTGDQIYYAKNYIVYINGTPIGIHRSPQQFLKNFRFLRRKGKINSFVSGYEHQDHRAVYLSSDGGRLVRPLMIVDGKSGQILVKQRHIKEIVDGNRCFQDLVHDGLVEFLDVNQQNNALIAVRQDEIKAGQTTHMEIDPLTILGCVAGLIPYPHHNQSPRNTYQCAMGKQAVGSIGYNQMQRVDTVLNLLLYPQKPMVKTKTIEMINFHKLPAGQNAMVAIMSYSGYDIEDAVILNKASLDRGYQRSLQYRRNTVQIKKYADGTSDAIQKPPTLDPQFKLNPKLPLPPIMKKFRNLDDDGLAKISSQVSTGDIYINKQAPTLVKKVESQKVGEENKLNVNNNNDTNSLNQQHQQQQQQQQVEYRPQPAVYKALNPAYIDKVILTSSHQNPFLVKVVLRQTRRPELGDKFSSRHGQKGVCGLIVNQIDMPFGEDGWCPDMIMNPHGFPSRMTVGKMIELISGKAGTFLGETRDGTAFAGDNVQEMGAILLKNGYNYQGKDLLMCGITGDLLPCYVFSGPIYYQRLKHMVQDKMHARSRGPKAVLTRQPTEGRSRDGGLRLGEMERDCLIGYGAANLLLERLMLVSDVFQVDICDTCGMFGYKGYCQFCKSVDNVCKVKMPYACKLLFQELQSMNIRPKLQLKDV